MAIIKRAFRTIIRLPKTVALALIGAYRLLLSPMLGNRCRFYPSCSLYARTSIERFGFLRGCYLTARRLLRCHPFHPGGVDPVPEAKSK